MDKTKLNLERLRAYDAEWDENKHPRADNGQFTSGGSAGSSSGASGTKKYNQNELKPKEQKASKSPLRQAAEAVQGKSTKATPEFGSEKFHFDVSNYKTVVSGKDANTPEGEVHNSIIGMLETDNPTKYDIANAAFYLADEDYNDKVRHCREMIRKAKAQGKSKASQEWGEALIKANKQVTLLNAIGEAMRK
nr:MAG TPA: hypothetical protein [Caudoviricetes sp.]